MRFTAKMDDFGAVMDQIVTEADRAGTMAIDDVTQGVKSELRDQVQAAGLGTRLATTWQGRRYPVNRFSMDAAAFVWSKAPKIVAAFDQGAVIRSKEGFYLAIPTPAAGARGIGATGKSVRISPGAWERRTGIRLRFVYRRNGPSLLVADNAAIGRSGIARAATRRTRDGAEFVRLQGRLTVVIFILVPQVTLRKRLDIEGVAHKWADKLPDLLATHWT